MLLLLDRSLVGVRVVPEVHLEPRAAQPTDHPGAARTAFCILVTWCAPWKRPFLGLLALPGMHTPIFQKAPGWAPILPES